MNRYISNLIFISMTRLALGFCALLLVFLLAVITINGAKAINLEFLFTASRDFGAQGGILYQIIGSILLILFAALISFPLALGTAIFKSEYFKNGFMKKICITLIYGLNGVPSVIFGIFGLIFFVNILNTGLSWFVGSIILAMMILPTIIMSSYQAINSVPSVYRENALALGFSRWDVIIRVLLARAVSGALTGLLLGLARAIGETAPIMFIATAFSGVNIPGGFSVPVTALPTHILALAQQATNQDALQNAWGASLVLLVLVVLFSLAAFISRTKLDLVSQR